MTTDQADRTAEAPPPAHQARPRRRRTVLVATGCTLAVLLVAGSLTAALATAQGVGPAAPRKAAPPATAPITKGTLAGSSSASGTLSFSGSRTIAGGAGGVITALPAPGATAKLGDALFSIANVRTFLMYGSLPAWRSFESGMSDGPDVQALEESLKALGYFDREPDQEFTWATKEAILDWQKATGQERTGSIPLGGVVFAGGPVRVASLKAAVGDQAGAGAPLIAVTDLAKDVRVDLPLADQGLGVVGNPVSIDLPDGTSTTGKIASVGVPTEKEGSSQDKQVVIPVVVTLDDPAAVGALQEASVTVGFPSEKRDGVLSVPVGALLALDDRRFGVEVVRPNGTTERVPVKTGLFAAGRVEISGDGIAAGQDVVVPKL